MSVIVMLIVMLNYVSLKNIYLPALDLFDMDLAMALYGNAIDILWYGPIALAMSRYSGVFRKSSGGTSARGPPDVCRRAPS